MSLSSNSAGVSSGLRWYLLFTAMVTGAVIMIIEILGAKLLAPYLGTSHFVWTAQIGVTLVALATGYAIGGRLADRAKGLNTLYWAILLAAIYVALSVRWSEAVAYWSLEQGNLPTSSLLSAVVLYFPPLALLAITPPFLIRALTTSLQSVGGSAGRLSAISTVGSVLGTILVGYVLIPLLPNSKIMFSASATLLVLAAIYFVVWGGRAKTQATVSAIAGLALGYDSANQPFLREGPTTKELFRGNSNFGLIQVVDIGSGANTIRCYQNDRLFQNTYLHDSRQSGSLFTYMLTGLARVYTPEIRDALCIGMGVGVVPMELAQVGVKVDVVEINDAIVPVAEKYFHFDSKKVQLHIGDGRHFLAASKKKYDTIIIDAFLGESVPGHLMSLEALTAARDHLNPNGTLVMNTFGDSTFGRDYFLVSVYKTLQKVFPEIRIHSTGNGNVFFLAGERKGLSRLHAPDLTRVPKPLEAEVRTAYEATLNLESRQGDVLTDDFNPVDFRDAENREKIRRNLALSARSASR